MKLETYLSRLRKDQQFLQEVSELSVRLGVNEDDLREGLQPICNACWTQAVRTGEQSQVERLRKQLTQCNATAMRDISDLRAKILTGAGFEVCDIEFHEPLQYLDEETRDLVLTIILDKLRMIAAGKASGSLLQMLLEATKDSEEGKALQAKLAELPRLQAEAEELRENAAKLQIARAAEVKLQKEAVGLRHELEAEREEVARLKEEAAQREHQQHQFPQQTSQQPQQFSHQPSQQFSQQPQQSSQEPQQQLAQLSQQLATQQSQQLSQQSQQLQQLQGHAGHDANPACCVSAGAGAGASAGAGANGVGSSAVAGNASSSKDKSLAAENGRLRVLVEELRMKVKDLIEACKRKGVSSALLDEVTAELALGPVLGAGSVFERLYKDAMNRLAKYAQMQEAKQSELLAQAENSSLGEELIRNGFLEIKSINPGLSPPLLEKQSSMANSVICITEEGDAELEELASPVVAAKKSKPLESASVAGSTKAAPDAKLERSTGLAKPGAVVSNPRSEHRGGRGHPLPGSSGPTEPVVALDDDEVPKEKPRNVDRKAAKRKKAGACELPPLTTTSSSPALPLIRPAAPQTPQQRQSRGPPQEDAENVVEFLRERRCGVATPAGRSGDSPAGGGSSFALPRLPQATRGGRSGAGGAPGTPAPGTTVGWPSPSRGHGTPRSLRQSVSTPTLPHGTSRMSASSMNMRLGRERLALA